MFVDRPIDRYSLLGLSGIVPAEGVDQIIPLRLRQLPAPIHNTPLG
jgi:hypothetical protein